MRDAEKVKFKEEENLKILRSEDKKFLGMIDRFEYKPTQSSLTMTDTPIGRIKTGDVVPNVIVVPISKIEFKIFDKWIEVGSDIPNM
jgi:hypothetical protein